MTEQEWDICDDGTYMLKSLSEPQIGYIRGIGRWYLDPDLIRCMVGNPIRPVTTFKIGDLVCGKEEEGQYLRCGSGRYEFAVITSLNPFTLVSPEGDMLWTHIAPTQVTWHDDSPFPYRTKHNVTKAFERWDLEKRSRLPDGKWQFFDETYCSRNVLQIAQTILKEKRFGDMPILADALGEAGYSGSQLLSHCRTLERYILCPNCNGLGVLDTKQIGGGSVKRTFKSILKKCSACNGSKYTGTQQLTHTVDCWVLRMIEDVSERL